MHVLLLLYSWKFSPISPPPLVGEIFIHKFDMVTFTALKIYSTEYFCNTKVAGLGEIFIR